MKEMSSQKIKELAYGFELDLERLEILLVKYGDVWQQVRGDLTVFVDWLDRLASEMENPL